MIYQPPPNMGPTMVHLLSKLIFCALVLASGSIAQNGHESDSTVQAEGSAADAVPAHPVTPREAGSVLMERAFLYCGGGCSGYMCNGSTLFPRCCVIAGKCMCCRA
ncbi:hypothetical protein BDV34DRAFT_56910 [Aspergillus parasiticus]|uniref:Uncharacterized protein n=1 Tax=Aspergillus parasiticus TaxID=5067 RepID=A0A5N6DSE5_ASPPA|nr:hypothetical protein BDV34DRAFT_56910 [Aspergillus parasiticus]